MDKEKSTGGFQPCLDLLKLLARASVATVLAICTLDLPAQAGFLEKWRFDPAANQLEITLKEGTTPRFFLLSEPLRIVLDLPNTTLGNVETQQSYSGAVRQIRVAQFQPDITRIVLELSPDVMLTTEQVQLRAVASSGDRWVLRPQIAGFQTPATRASLTTLPPATFPEIRTPVVKVPPLSRPQPSTPSTPAPVTNSPATTPLQVVTLDARSIETQTNQQPSISIPTSEGVTSQTPAPAAVPEIEFGQPLPSSQGQQVQTKPSAVAPPPPNSAGVSGGGKPAQATMSAAQTPACRDVSCKVSTLPAETGVISTTSAAPAVKVPPLNQSTAAKPAGNSPTLAPDVLLPAGTVLTLRYPGEKAVTLQPGYPLQEVLLLKEAIRDRTGNIIAPLGTPVIGRFETDSRGSRFIAQAIILDGRNISLEAQPVPLPRNRQDSHNRIEPNQLVSVQLKQDLR